MDEKVRQFIERRKSEMMEEHKKILAEIPEFQVREYSDLKICSKEYPLWDAVKMQPFRVTLNTDISEEDFEAMRKYITQSNTLPEDSHLVMPSDGADKALQTLSTICLIMTFVGLITVVVGLVAEEEIPLFAGLGGTILFYFERISLRWYINVSVRLRQIVSCLNNLKTK